MCTCQEGVKIGSDLLKFYVPVKNFSLIWRCRPMLGAQGVCQALRREGLYRATPAIAKTWTIIFPVSSKDQVLDPPPFKNSWIRL
jgi:hypothetical protein